MGRGRQVVLQTYHLLHNVLALPAHLQPISQSSGGWGARGVGRPELGRELKQ